MPRIRSGRSRANHISKAHKRSVWERPRSITTKCITIPDRRRFETPASTSFQSPHIRQNRRTNIPPVKVETFYISDVGRGMPDIILSRAVSFRGHRPLFLLLIRAGWAPPKMSIRIMSLQWVTGALSPRRFLMQHNLINKKPCGSFLQRSWENFYARSNTLWNFTNAYAPISKNV